MSVEEIGRLTGEFGGANVESLDQCVNQILGTQISICAISHDERGWDIILPIGWDGIDLATVEHLKQVLNNTFENVTEVKLNMAEMFYTADGHEYEACPRVFPRGWFWFIK